MCWTEEDFAAAQAARRTAAAQGLAVWPDALDAPLRAHADKLAGLAVRQRLVVFMGAGIGAAAGLPTWSELLDRLADEAGFSGTERDGLSRLGPLDRAQLVSKRLGEPGALGLAVRRALDNGGAVALAHGLVAGLPLREFITTNYDDCFERACAAIDRPVARLPYVPASGAHRWLLKMHGCVSVPSDIVLTWEDYARYAQRSAALAGIVQAMLMTKHMLFVGFSSTTRTSAASSTTSAAPSPAPPANTSAPWSPCSPTRSSSSSGVTTCSGLARPARPPRRPRCAARRRPALRDLPRLPVVPRHPATPPAQPAVLRRAHRRGARPARGHRAGARLGARAAAPRRRGVRRGGLGPARRAAVGPRRPRAPG
ncbi:MAG: SIR2 family protein [Myxococcota bacterium]